jgi:preprotein translocase subunit SecA
LGVEALRNLERYIMLNIVDAQWKDHLLALDHLKEGIGLRGYGQKDPLVEYKRESFYLFQAMLDRIDTETIRYLFNFQVQVPRPLKAVARAPPPPPRRPRSKARDRLAGAGKAASRFGTRVHASDDDPCLRQRQNKKCCGTCLCL